jgi:methylmalonyl-CoA mutase C-terminal domain/subunit
MIANAAIQEDVDVIGLSILSGAHLAIFPRIMEEIKNRKIDALVIAGGTIPDEDVESVRALGVAGVFGPGTSFQTIIDFLHANAPVREDVL